VTYGLWCALGQIRTADTRFRSPTVGLLRFRLHCAATGLPLIYTSCVRLFPRLWARLGYLFFRSRRRPFDVSVPIRCVELALPCSLDQGGESNIGIGVTRKHFAYKELVATQPTNAPPKYSKLPSRPKDLAGGQVDNPYGIADDRRGVGRELDAQRSPRRNPHDEELLALRRRDFELLYLHCAPTLAPGRVGQAVFVTAAPALHRSGGGVAILSPAGLRIDSKLCRWLVARCDAGASASSTGLRNADAGPVRAGACGRRHRITPAVAGAVNGDVSMSRRGALTGSGCHFFVGRACPEVGEAAPCLALLWRNGSCPAACRVVPTASDPPGIPGYLGAPRGRGSRPTSRGIRLLAHLTAELAVRVQPKEGAPLNDVAQPDGSRESGKPGEPAHKVATDVRSESAVREVAGREQQDPAHHCDEPGDKETANRELHGLRICRATLVRG
jgi:hypothetical protein